MVETEQAAQPLTAPNSGLLPASLSARGIGKQQEIILALVISLMMKMGDILPKRVTERALPEQD